ncbi:MAG: PepSY domain-containing protein [Bryobacterales bacterium]|nr:PepSY domain-containing protein [Bryobacterales bacterium]
MRKILFWLHLAAGCAAGLVVFIMSVTGVALTYERQILASGAPRVKADRGVTPYSMEALLEKYRERRGRLPAAVVKRAGEDAPVEFQMGREGTAYIDPYRGVEVQGSAGGARRFFRVMTDWHRWLGQEGEGREVGRAITGACNLAFLFLVLSGMYLWIPRVLSWKHFRAVLLFRGGLEGKAREFNWHNVFGIWMALPLAAVVSTAAVMSYGWANDLLYRAATGKPAPAGIAKKKGAPAGKGKGKGKGPGPALGAPPVDLPLAGLKEIWSRVEVAHSGYESIALRMPMAAGGAWQFTVDRGNGARPDLRTTLTFDAATSAMLQREEFAEQDAGRRARTWVRWLHTGEAGGIAGQTLAGLASLAGAMLVYTGVALSLRRLAAWRRRAG